MDRYVIQFQNPKYSFECFIWDRKDRKVVISYAYPEGTIDAQQKAKRKCEAYFAENLTQEVIS
jgi:hypothetical protein